MGTHDLDVSRVPRTADYERWAARMHGVRMFFIGLLLDVAVAGTVFLATVISELEWTRTYWLALGLGLAKSVIQGAVAYLVRMWIKPSPPAS